MLDYPYTVVSGKVRQFFSQIQTAGIPDKVTGKYLEMSGFKSSNDRAIMRVLKFIRFIDAQGVPTERWRAYRDKRQSQRVIAESVREAYADLFSAFPDADRKDNEALRNYFGAHTKASEAVLTRIVNTFKTLCDLGDFQVSEHVASGDKVAEHLESVVQRRAKGTAGLTLNVNIQLQLPATEDTSIYDKLFGSMKKHLMPD